MKKTSPSRATRRDRPVEKAARYLPGAIAIVHEDDDVIVVDKPAGMPTVTPPGQDAANLFGALKDYVREKVRRRGTRVWIIHRLDKEASGLLVFAKSEHAFERLKEDFRAKRVHRQYAAVVEGGFREPRDEETKRQRDAEGEKHSPAGRAGDALIAGTIRSFLYEDEQGLVHSVASPMEAPRPRARRPDEEDNGEARLAVTHYRVLRSGHGRSLVQVRLETGRKHQIRVHMAQTGHGIVGDRRYGARTDPIGRLCLHAIELGFEHPKTGKDVRFRSATPGTFAMLVGGEDEATRDGAAKPAPGPAAERLRPTTSASTPGPTSPESALAAVPPAAPAQRASAARAESSWDHVAEWYDALLEERGSDHHENVIFPGTLRLLALEAGNRVLDVACGQGLLCRRFASLEVAATGIDASERLIEAARSADAKGRYLLGDARSLGGLGLTTGFDAATCVMALMNIDPIGPLLVGVASLLRPGGRFVGVILHPAFRAPGLTSWQWEEPRRIKPRGAAFERKNKGAPRRLRESIKLAARGTPSADADARQFRRVDGYLTPARREIVMNPGAVSSGAKPVTTVTFHRPVEAYVKALAAAGLLIDALEEWPSTRSSQPGPRAAEENRARREIPLFLAIRAVKPIEAR